MKLRISVCVEFVDYEEKKQQSTFNALNTVSPGVTHTVAADFLS